MISESIKLKSKAHQKPLTANPGITSAAIRIINPLMTRRKSPNVITVIGIVRKINIGLTVMFKSAIIAATTNAVRYPSTATPGNKKAVIKTARAATTNCNKIPIVSLDLLIFV
ncbi:hypothetical protein EL17_07920 [Anditalea andensis]|uniref:Uncharacterized protein n=1 Tax=Anditalea andensis TaxID=1048983 RepID=A0A074KYP3_9BACT|nr:hypothetical protein EL17_07920 [Anditalea andensis]